MRGLKKSYTFSPISCLISNTHEGVKKKSYTDEGGYNLMNSSLCLPLTFSLSLCMICRSSPGFTGAWVPGHQECNCTGKSSMPGYLALAVQARWDATNIAFCLSRNNCGRLWKPSTFWPHALASWDTLWGLGYDVLRVDQNINPPKNPQVRGSMVSRSCFITFSGPAHQREWKTKSSIAVLAYTFLTN